MMWNGNEGEKGLKKVFENDEVIEGIKWKGCQLVVMEK